jgi:hypothetical protein
MHTRILALAALAFLTANSAKATTYFDTIGASDALNGSADGAGEGSSLVAQSFSVPGTPNLSVTLALSADPVANDTGSFMVYLVPDDQSGGGVGMAGNPLTVNSLIAATGFASSSVLLGTVSDSSISDNVLSPTLLTFLIPSSDLLALNAANGGNTDQEYWIGLATGTSSTIEWSETGDTTGIGLTNQEYFDNQSNSFGETYLIDGSPELTITSAADAPEPATLAILGAGLAGIGYVRRRKVKQG